MSSLSWIKTQGSSCIPPYEQRHRILHMLSLLLSIGCCWNSWDAQQLQCNLDISDSNSLTLWKPKNTLQAKTSHFTPILQKYQFSSMIYRRCMNVSFLLKNKVISKGTLLRKQHTSWKWMSTHWWYHTWTSPLEWSMLLSYGICFTFTFTIQHLTIFKCIRS